MLNSMIYEVEFPDNQVNYYEANTIAENMISKVDDKGYSVTLVYSSVDYNRDDSGVDKADNFIVIRRGQRWPTKTPQGWKLLVVWNYGSKI